MSLQTINIHLLLIHDCTLNNDFYIQIIFKFIIQFIKDFQPRFFHYDALFNEIIIHKIVVLIYFVFQYRINKNSNCSVEN